MQQLGSTSEQSRLYNERIILQTIRRHPGVSRAQIAERTGLSAQTISVITSALLGKGLLKVTGRVKGNRGQPSVKLEIDGTGAYGLGINIDRDHIGAALIDFCGRSVLIKECAVRFPSEHQAKTIVTSLLEEIAEFLGEEYQGKIHGIGLAIPDHMPQWLESLVIDGELRQHLPELKEALTYWQTEAFSDWLKEHTGWPVVKENDANAAAMNELLLGRVHQEDFFYVFIGAAGGGGVVVQGDCYRGAHGRAGDFGQIPAAKGSLGKQLLEVLSITSLARFLEASGKSLPDSPDAWLDAGIHLLTNDWMERVADEVVPALISVVALLDPHTIRFGGRLPEPILQSLVAVLKGRVEVACPDTMEAPPFVVAHTAGTTGVVGAAVLPLFETFAPQKSWLLLKR